MMKLAGVLVVGSLCAQASAGEDVPLPDLFDIEVNWSGQTWLASNNPESFTVTEVIDPQTEKMTYQITGQWTGADWMASWAITFDPDPFISSALVQLANVGSDFEEFEITVTAPIAPALTGPTTMTGSVSGFVGDGDGALNSIGQGATVRTFGGKPFYEALVDGVGVRQLYADPQEISAMQGLTADIDMANFIDEVGPGVNSTIGITNAFALSQGDNAGFTSTFFIIPTPGAATLLLLAGLATIGRRR